MKNVKKLVVAILITTIGTAIVSCDNNQLEDPHEITPVVKASGDYQQAVAEHQPSIVFDEINIDKMLEQRSGFEFQEMIRFDYIVAAKTITGEIDHVLLVGLEKDTGDVIKITKVYLSDKYGKVGREVVRGSTRPFEEGFFSLRLRTDKKLGKTLSMSKTMDLRYSKNTLYTALLNNQYDEVEVANYFANKYISEFLAQKDY